MRPLARALTPLAAVLFVLALEGCSKTENVGLLGPGDAGRPTPVITSINSPAGVPYAVIDTIIISGSNFSSVLAENTVYFGSQPATLLTSSPTRISLISPAMSSDSVSIRVMVLGAYAFSNSYPYRLIIGVQKFGGLDTAQQAAGLAVDATGNLYAANCTSGKDAGILLLTPAGVRSIYATFTQGVPMWTGLKVGPGGYLYATRSLRAIYRFAPGGGAGATIWCTFSGGTAVDLDFDQDGNLWAGGNNNTNLYRFDQTPAVTAYPFTGSVHAVRVFNGYLYFAAKTDAGEQIWRAPIAAGVLGTPEVYFNFGAAFPNSVPQAITLSSDGTLIIGVDTREGLVIVSPGKTATAPFAGFSVLNGGIRYLAWGAANDLYASATGGALVRFSIRGQTSAPYYGAK